jgi:hypothetical protein
MFKLSRSVIAAGLLVVATLNVYATPRPRPHAVVPELSGAIAGTALACLGALTLLLSNRKSRP